jgi:magnesium transporter
VQDPLASPDGVVWFDLFAPSNEEETRLEAVLGIGVPTLDEMAEIEDSSRLYVDEGAVFMTATLPAKADTGHPVAVPVTFILTGGRLVTVRYDTTRAFESFPQRAERLDLGCSSGETVLLALLEAIVERLADILEAVGRDIEGLSRDIFRRGAAREGRSQDYRGVLQGVGSQGDVVSHALASLVTLERLVAFFGAVSQGSAAKEWRGRLKSLARDTRFLAEHAGFLAQKVTFLLDATLGMISIQQNDIIKIFSVAAVIFLPPTLVASVYGMNFARMPELNWLFGYPFALGLMVASAAASYWVFKIRGWL